MATTTEVRDEIYSVLIDNFTTTPYTIENIDLKLMQSDSWVRLSVNHQLASQETLGRTSNRRFIRQGIINIQIFTLSNTGTGLSSSISDELTSLYEARQFNTFYTDSATLREVGITDRWYQINLEINFSYEEVK